MAAFLTLTRLNEAGNESGDVVLNVEHIEALVGEETGPSVRVMMASGAQHVVAQPQGDKHKSVLARVNEAS